MEHLWLPEDDEHVSVGCSGVSSVELVSVSELLGLGLGWGAAALHLRALLGQTPALRGRLCCHHTSSEWEQGSFCHPALSPEVLRVGVGACLQGSQTALPSNPSLTAVIVSRFV